MTDYDPSKVYIIGNMIDMDQNFKYRPAPFQPLMSGTAETGKLPLSHVQQTPGLSPSFGTVPSTPSLNSSSKQLNSRQLVHYERLNASLDLKMELETARFERNLSNLIRKRLVMQQKSQEKMTGIQSLLEAKRHQIEALQRKKAELSKYLGCSEENISLESMQNHLAEFERNWAQFVQVCYCTVNESSNQEAVSDVVSKKEFELDGDAIVTGLKDTGISEERITNTVYANIDQGVNIKNINIGPLLQDGKLDLINLTRWHNLTMSVVTKALTKIDTKKINMLAKSFNKETESGLPDCSSLDASISMNILAENKTINQEANILKAKLDAFLPKFGEKTEKLFDRVRNEFETGMSKEKSAELQDENVFEFINGYFNLVRGPIIDQRRLSEIKKAQQDQQEQFYQDTSLPADDDFPKENFNDETSLGMIDVDDSNYDLI